MSFHALAAKFTCFICGNKLALKQSGRVKAAHDLSNKTIDGKKSTCISKSAFLKKNWNELFGGVEMPTLFSHVCKTCYKAAERYLKNNSDNRVGLKLYNFQIPFVTTKSYRNHLQSTKLDQYDCLICNKFQLNLPPKPNPDRVELPIAEREVIAQEKYAELIAQFPVSAIEPPYQPQPLPNRRTEINLDHQPILQPKPPPQPKVKPRNRKRSAEYKKKCYPKTTKLKPASYGSKRKLCHKCYQFTNHGIRHICTKRKAIANIASQLQTQDADQQVASTVIANVSSATKGSSISLRTLGRTRTLNLRSQSRSVLKKASKRKQLLRATFERRRCGSNVEFFRRHQHGKRNLVGKGILLADKVVAEALKKNVRDLSSTSYRWMTYNPQAIDQFNLALTRYKVDESCALCMCSSRVVKELEHLKPGTEVKCKLLADKSLRVDPEDSSSYQKLFRVGHIKRDMISELLERVCKVREWDLEEIIVKIGFDFGQGCSKLCMQLYTEQFLRISSAQGTPVNTTDTTFIMAISYCKESQQSTEVLWQLGCADLLLDLYLKKEINDFVLTTDLSQLAKLCGLKSGNSKYPCCFCQYMGALNKNDKEKEIDQFGHFNKRTPYQWIEAWGKIGTKDYNLSVDHVAVHKQLVLSIRPLIAPPPLHIMLGLVNSIFEAIEKLKINNLLETWLNESKAYKNGQDKKFNGPNCYKLMSNFECFDRYRHEDLSMYSELLQAVKEANSCYNKIGRLDADELKLHESKIEAVLSLWKVIPSLTSRPHKLHMMRHIVEFEQSRGFRLGNYSETEFESIHAKFKPVLDNFKRFDDRLSRSIDDWNSVRFQLHEQYCKKIGLFDRMSSLESQQSG